MSMNGKPNWWAAINTLALVVISVLGFFARYWMASVDIRLTETVNEIRRLNNEIRDMQHDKMYEKGRMAGIKEALEAQKPK